MAESAKQKSGSPQRVHSLNIKQTTISGEPVSSARGAGLSKISERQENMLNLKVEVGRQAEKNRPKKGVTRGLAKILSPINAQYGGKPI